MLIILDVTLNFINMSELHHYTSWINSVVCFCRVQFRTLNVHIRICFCTGFHHAHLCTNDYPYYSCMGFRHAHLCTNEYPYSYGFSSCTFLYKWQSIFFLYGFSSCKFLYEWLSVFIWVFVMNISLVPWLETAVTFKNTAIFPRL